MWTPRRPETGRHQERAPLTWPSHPRTGRISAAGRLSSSEEAAFRDLSDNPPPLAIDGIFGPKTEAFVRGIQQGVQIAVDGVVGPVTWQALISGTLSF